MVHKFSVSFYVRSNYSNRDGMEPVISRINLDGKRLSIGSTGVKVMPGHWDGLTGRVRGDDEQAARSNEELDRIAYSLYSVYYQIGQHHQITIGDIKAQYKRCDGDITTVKKLLEKFNSFKLMARMARPARPRSISTCSQKDASWICSGQDTKRKTWGCTGCHP